MKILLNNNEEEIPRSPMTIDQLLQHKNFTFKMLVVKVNGQLVKKAYYATAELREGDEVHVLHLISGG